MTCPTSLIEFLPKIVSILLQLIAIRRSILFDGYQRVRRRLRGCFDYQEESLLAPSGLVSIVWRIHSTKEKSSDASWKTNRKRRGDSANNFPLFAWRKGRSDARNYSSSLFSAGSSGGGLSSIERVAMIGPWFRSITFACWGGDRLDL